MDTSASRQSDVGDTAVLTDAPIPLAPPTAASVSEDPWWRSPDPDGVITGLSAFLAERLALDPLWIRLAFILLALLGGLGLLAYAGLWLALIVARDGERPWARPLGGAIVVAGLPLMISGATLNLWTGPVALIGLLAGLTFSLWRPAPTTRSVESTPTMVPAPSSDDEHPATPAPARRRDTRPPRPAREPSVLGRATVGLAVIVAACGALVDQLNNGRLHPEQWLGAAAVVCGLGLLVGTVRGTARWLVVPAICLGIAGYGGGVLARSGIDLQHINGNQYLTVFGDAGGRQSVETGFGTVFVSIDQQPTRQVTIDVNVGIGDIDVTRSDDVTVQVRSNFGDIAVWSDGVRKTADIFTVGPEGEPDVIINASLQKGRMLISSFPASVEPTDDEIADELAAGDGSEFSSDTYTEGQRDAAIDLVVTRNGATGVTQIADGVQVTDQGWLVLGDSSAVVDDAGNVVLGNSYSQDGATIIIESDRGEYRLIGPILLTPEGAVFDVETIRAAARQPVVTVPPVAVDDASSTPSDEAPVTGPPSSAEGEG